MNEQFTCTCGYFQEEWLHHVECGLWDSVDFTMGSSMWDWRKVKLVESHWEGFGRSDECWDLIIDTEGTHINVVDGDTVGAASTLELTIEDTEEVYAANDDVDAIIEAWRREHDEALISEVTAEVTEAEWASNEGPDELKCFCMNEEKGTFCGPCGLTRKSVKDPWGRTYLHEQWLKKPTKCECNPVCPVTCDKSGSQRWSSGATKWVFFNPSMVLGKSTYQGGGFTQKCRHYGIEIEFPDGTTIYASSLKNSKKAPEDLIPDLGIYMAGSWNPTSVAFHLGWNDFDLPMIPDDHVRWIIETGVAWARNQKIVEIGCIGGHGRTGSVMALMALHCGIDDPVEACKWVWKNYCTHAIESDKQEWYVSKYAALLHGTEVPPMPVYKPTVNTTVKPAPPLPHLIGSHASGSGVKTPDDEKPSSQLLLSGYGLNASDWEDLMGLL